MSPEQAEYFMSLALELAQAAEKLDEVPIGAILVHNNQVIGRGHNFRETTGRTTAHAEIQALEDYNQRTGQWRLPSNALLFVTVEPCIMCTGALLWARVDKVFFGASDPKQAGLSKFQALIETGLFDHRFNEIRSGLLEERGRSLISNYFKKKRGAHVGY
ncbi:nucleoside deaminase [bacterium]|nr:nucleoside deaminase [bacterium]